MAQNNSDQLAKQYLEEFLTPCGTVQRQYEIPGEAKFVDVWFVPNPSAFPEADLGLLGRMVQKPCLLEPYRNAPSRTELRVSVLKLLWIQEDERRKARKEELAEKDLPFLWVLAATVSAPLLTAAKAVVDEDWMPGVYFIADLFKTGIIVIDQLPETAETLWLRILGRSQTQERAIRQILALPKDHPRRETILRLLSSWKVRMDIGEIENFTDQETIMALSESFLAWEQEAVLKWKNEERRTIAFNLLRQNVTLEAISQATGLTIEDLQKLRNESK
jgi:hypothetical protein